VWRRRSQTTWTLDLSILTGADITIVPLPDAAAVRRSQWTRSVLASSHSSHGVQPATPNAYRRTNSGARSAVLGCLRSSGTSNQPHTPTATSSITRARASAS
jgi:hypothetical protein